MNHSEQISADSQYQKMTETPVARQGLNSVSHDGVVYEAFAE